MINTSTKYKATIGQKFATKANKRNKILKKMDSMSKYSPKPPATPAITLSVRERYNFFFAMLIRYFNGMYDIPQFDLPHHIHASNNAAEPRMQAIEMLLICRCYYKKLTTVGIRPANIRHCNRTNGNRN